MVRAGDKMKIAQFQMHVYNEKEKNIAELKYYLEKIKDQDVDLVAIGEMFNCPYSNDNFPIYAEPEGGETWMACSNLAANYGIYLSAGSIPEIDAEGRLYNTAYVFDRAGKQIAKHRKIHLFDIDIKGKQSFKESDTLTPGEGCTVFDTEFGKIGVCICFDIRFPELFYQMTKQGVQIILIPAAFNTTTGPAHWELLFRCRAVDNQCYIAGTCEARDETASYKAWGHSLFVSPWGDIIQELDEKAGYMIHEVDFDYLKQIREELPVLSARKL
ncbi:MAG: carbon-nitrogen hydrolase family protein [Lachnospiraceae bacterium]|nr:carbon-nitrogen hydrolase family protein [Lachnospiraceae bacterium]MDD3616778.1 carbon-nitrogen hydrolase family protein [Lachnospiraceae bacterium]